MSNLFKVVVIISDRIEIEVEADNPDEVYEHVMNELTPADIIAQGSPLIEIDDIYPST